LDSTVEEYLTLLRQELGGADPALVQDALYDAEEYLRSALAETNAADPSAVADVFEMYGTPAEVAESYRSAEITVAAALRSPAPIRQNANPFVRFLSVVADPRAWASLFYLVLAGITGTFYFTVVITGLSVSLSTIILIIGVPIALLFIAIVRALAFAEGRMVEGLLGIRMPRRPRYVAQQGMGFWERVKLWLADVRTWTSMLYMVLQMPLGIVYVTLIAVVFSVSSALVCVPFLQVLSGEPVIRTMNYGYYLDPWAFPLVLILGLVGYVLMLWMAKGIGAAHGLYAKALLVGRAEQEQSGAIHEPVERMAREEGGAS